MPSLTAVCLYRSDTRSKLIAEAMCHGIRAQGDVATMVAAHKYLGRPSGHVAVFYGYKDGMREIFRDYLKDGRKVIFWDLGYACRRFGDHGRERYQGYHRMAFNARHADNTVMDGACPSDRLDQLKINPRREIELNLSPHRKGKYILVAGMQFKSCFSYDVEYESWEREAIRRIKEVTDRPIIYRPKPKDRLAKPIEGTIYSDRRNKLGAILKDCHAVVTHHSNVGVEGLIHGIPVYCDSGISKPLASGGLSDLHTVEKPQIPADEERQRWLNNLAYWQWSVPEMNKGLPWQWLKSKGYV